MCLDLHFDTLQAKPRGGHKIVVPARRLCHHSYGHVVLQVAQPLSLNQQPVLERRIMHPDPIEQVAAIMLDGAPAGLNRLIAQKLLESANVNRRGTAIKRHRLAV